MRTLSAVALFVCVYADTVSAQCRVEENVDQITMTATTTLICHQNEREFAVFSCAATGELRIGLFPSDYVGGENSAVTLRGDAQSSSYSFQSVVGNDGQWLMPPASSFLPLLQAFQSSTQVFIRFVDYRRVSQDFTISATNFTEASSQLVCITSLLERAAEREAQAVDGESIRAEMEARGCEMRKEGWACPE